MLKLSNITKTYTLGSEKIPALRGIDIELRKNEFVAILGPSGCGKTTLLNIIGGLDQYTEGDLIIGGKSTKEFKDADWDSYRNHSIGFVFQSYNLIPHQTVLSNVELALTLSGVSKSERRRRAIDALNKVGLGDQLRKKPSQMSGGQMQRVAIARALVNDPEILLADEPTGALDSGTSVQIMEILREVAKDRLVIMVTHNPELAEQYATRTVRLLDGSIISDSDPFAGETDKVINKKAQGKAKRTSMSFLTALSLSANNLLTKKARTILTSFAGSIGIIGIALILAVSTGVQAYIDRVQEDTLSSYPLSIQAQSIDMTSMMTSMMEAGQAGQAGDHDLDAVYGSAVLYELLNAINKIETSKNDLAPFIDYLEGHEEFNQLATMHLTYNLPMNIYTTDKDGTVFKSDVSILFKELFKMMYQDGTAEQMASVYASSMKIWQEMTPGKDGALISELLSTQYDVIHGAWPQNENEIVLIVNENNEISDLVLYALGLRTAGELYEYLEAASKGEEIEGISESWSYEEICGLDFRLIPAFCGYEKNETTGVWTSTATTPEGLKALYDSDDVIHLKVSGIVRPSENAVSGMMTGSIGHTYALTEKLIDLAKDAEIIKDQLENDKTNVLTGLPFLNTDASTGTGGFGDLMGGMMGGMGGMMGGMGSAGGSGEMPTLPGTGETTTVPGTGAGSTSPLPDDLSGLYPQFTATKESVLSSLGYVEKENPSALNIYVSTFADKDRVAEIIQEYNDSAKEESQISYTDYVKLLMSSITTIINAISYVLIGFVAVSLVVSSIMIGIITYISVLERTKEIGILRAIGASKKDISNVFNAETAIVGFASGVFGIAFSLLCILIINVILHALTGIPNLNAILPPVAALVLIALSMGLTLIAGIIPSRLAAKKDPVIALRSE